MNLVLVVPPEENFNLKEKNRTISQNYESVPHFEIFQL